jgi:hypothetical protein
MELNDPRLLKALRTLTGLGRPACRVYGRKDCFLIEPMGLFSHAYLMPAGPVVRLDRDAPVEEVGQAALSALATYREFPDRPPPDNAKADPLLKAAGVKSHRGFTLGSAMLSVERVGKRIAIVPYNSETSGTQMRHEPSQALCSPQAKPVGERILRLMERQARHNRDLRKDEREHRDEIEADNRQARRVRPVKAKPRKASPAKRRKQSE